MIIENKFSSPEELHQFLIANKSKIIARKKYDVKKADGVSCTIPSITNTVVDVVATKAPTSAADLLAKNNIEVEVVINATRLLDSHGDVHIDGLWKKTLSEQRLIYLLQEHKMTFDHIISDEVKASTKRMKWSDLSIDMDGDTEALAFNAVINKSDSPYMFEMYAKGKVRQHSVGMRYIQLFLCVNSEAEYAKEEKENWDKYFPMVANKDAAEQLGYFWAVTQAQLVEGSAVPLGSNWATPTQSVKSFEPSADTQDNGPTPSPTPSLWEKIGKSL